MKLLSIICFALIFVSCSTNSSENNNTPQQNELKDTVPKVTGGYFLFLENPQKTRDWYADNLGLATNQWGSSFEFRNANRPNEINYYNGVHL